MQRVVITGMGIYSCLGRSLDEVRDSLFLGRSGIILDPVRKEMGFRSGLTAALPLPELKGELPRSQRVYMPQPAQYAYCATRDALKAAGIDQDYLDSHEVGLLYGNDSTADAVYKSISKIVEKKDTMLCGSGAIFQSMNSTVTMNLGVIFHLKGINLTVSGACASGSHAIGLGALLIQNGLQDIVVCGGAQEVNPAATGSFDGISAFSVREDNPAAASRPFDRDRDGLVPGGGAATVILESYESAVRRGAPIIAEVLGYGFSSNGDHISSPNVDGPSRSLEMAIRRSGIDIREIGYINAHATSTLVGDANEARALYRVFGQRSPRALPRIRRPEDGSDLHQIPDRPRDVDGGSIGSDLFHLDDEERFHRRQPQFQPSRRGIREAPDSCRKGGQALRHLPFQLLWFRRHEFHPRHTECLIS